MGYMEKELTDLQKGTIYTTEEIASIVNNKKDAMFLCDDTPYFQKGDTSSSYFVKNKIETFIHRNDGGSYFIPSSKQLIYILTKCK
ncbi:hypothetical protein [Bacillus sp. 1NLA3E]|uniref:hypothetical protein n=1 Tax=Bacillus sp. 1NLA3E TaxID=666686 RepID=UPI000247F19D|nr:hypothetical protein [Bacillus sp. 1NLA3E]AGK54020.1 hypothetical protein B1NLA3E_11340 [Bacillus sp. 1NLA3E]